MERRKREPAALADQDGGGRGHKRRGERRAARAAGAELPGAGGVAPQRAAGARLTPREGREDLHPGRGEIDERPVAVGEVRRPVGLVERAHADHVRERGRPARVVLRAAEGSAVPGRGDDDDAALRRVVDRRVLERRVRVAARVLGVARPAQAEVDHLGARVDRPADRARLVDDRDRAVRRDDLGHEQLDRDARPGRALGVAERRRDLARDDRAVAESGPRAPATRRSCATRRCGRPARDGRRPRPNRRRRREPRGWSGTSGQKSNARIASRYHCLGASGSFGSNARRRVAVSRSTERTPASRAARAESASSSSTEKTSVSSARRFATSRPPVAAATERSSCAVFAPSATCTESSPEAAPAGEARTVAAASPARTTAARLTWRPSPARRRPCPWASRAGTRS